MTCWGRHKNRSQDHPDWLCWCWDCCSLQLQPSPLQLLGCCKCDRGDLKRVEEKTCFQLFDRSTPISRLGLDHQLSWAKVNKQMLKLLTNLQWRVELSPILATTVLLDTTTSGLHANSSESVDRQERPVNRSGSAHEGEVGESCLWGKSKVTKLFVLPEP